MRVSTESREVLADPGTSPEILVTVVNTGTIIDGVSARVIGAGNAPVRSDDLYFGGAATDWVNLAKVAIPQADEQQRLLANLIVAMNDSRKPLPRFWYFPNGKKAVVIMTGDDHGNNGTAGRFDQFKALGPGSCSVANWECVRGTSYVYSSTPLTDAQVAYAASDVLHLHALKERLDAMLVREGRADLAAACFRFLPDRVRLDLAGWAAEDIFAHS